MLPYRLHTENEVIVVEFVALGLGEGPDLDLMATRLQEELMRSRSRKMVLDCSRLKFMASRGLSVIITLSRLAALHKGGFALCGLNAQLLQLLRFANLDRAIPIKPTRQEAIAALAAPPADETPPEAGKA